MDKELSEEEVLEFAAKCGLGKGNPDELLAESQKRANIARTTLKKFCEWRIQQNVLAQIEEQLLAGSANLEAELPEAEDAYNILECFDAKIQEIFDARDLERRMLAWIKRKAHQDNQDSDQEE